MPRYEVNHPLRIKSDTAGQQDFGYGSAPPGYRPAQFDAGDYARNPSLAPYDPVVNGLRGQAARQGAATVAYGQRGMFAGDRMRARLEQMNAPMSDAEKIQVAQATAGKAYANPTLLDGVQKPAPVARMAAPRPVGLMATSPALTAMPGSPAAAAPGSPLASTGQTISGGNPPPPTPYQPPAPQRPASAQQRLYEPGTQPGLAQWRQAADRFKAFNAGLRGRSQAPAQGGGLARISSPAAIRGVATGPWPRPADLMDNVSPMDQLAINNERAQNAAELAQINAQTELSKAQAGILKKRAAMSPDEAMVRSGVEGGLIPPGDGMAKLAEIRAAQNQQPAIPTGIGAKAFFNTTNPDLASAFAQAGPDGKVQPRNLQDIYKALSSQSPQGFDDPNSPLWGNARIYAKSLLGEDEYNRQTAAPEYDSSLNPLGRLTAGYWNQSPQQEALAKLPAIRAFRGDGSLRPVARPGLNQFSGLGHLGHGNILPNINGMDPMGSLRAAGNAAGDTLNSAGQLFKKYILPK